MNKRVCLAVAFWVICGYFNYGYCLGDDTHKFPDQQNQACAVGFALTGPFGVPATIIATGLHHWLIKPFTTEQRWEAFHKKWPEFSRDYFEEVDN